MSNKLFNNPKAARYLIALFLALFIFFLVKESKAETRFELGTTFLSGELSDGATLFISEVWDDKYLIGLGLVGEQTGNFSWKNGVHVKNNMLFQVQRLVTYERVVFGLGMAYFQHTNQALGDQMNFSLSIGYRATDHWDVQFRHFSNAGTATPNSGQDLLTVGYRFW